MTFDQNIRPVYLNIRAVYPNKNYVVATHSDMQSFKKIWIKNVEGAALQDTQCLYALIELSPK